MIQMKGTRVVPFFYFCMANEQVIIPIREMVEALLADKPEYFLVEIRIKPTNNIKVYLDADNGASIDKLVSLNRQLYPLLEAAALFPDGDFSLEVSSPGLDEPLKTHRQFVKNIGRKVEVTKTDGSVVEGKLLSVDDAELVLEETVGKKKELKQTNINLPEIKHTKVCIVF
ncbi:ribosome maturation factor [Chitinophaga sp. XS-30]|nr:ribosome maturation factor [Chitinophaga sp. XS-30]